MRVTVILSTYQNPHWLRRSLWGYSVQTRKPDEIIVADDGSAEETWHVMADVKRRTGLPIVHVWHQDQGFRKCEILNRAISRATGEYLIFSDGDCVPRHDFVEAHCRLARTGHFLSGGTLRLPLAISQRVDESAIENGAAFSPIWLLQNHMWLSRRSRQMHLLMASKKVARLVDQITSTRPTFNGHNASAWKSDVVAVNGFNERMQYGGLDRELGERLENLNVKGIQVRHRALSVHLDHGRPYINAQALVRNRAIRNETVSSKRTWTEHGILKGPNPAFCDSTMAASGVNYDRSKQGIAAQESGL